MRDRKSKGRPREFDEDAVLAKILDEFWAKGYAGTSLSDLVAATGLQKGSLYAAFGDKRAMYLKALTLYNQSAVETSVQLLSTPGAPKKRIAAFLQAAIDAVAVGKDRRGCFLCNASLDLAMADRTTARAVERGLARMADALETTLVELRGGKNQRAFAQHLLAVYLGLRVLAKSGRPVAELESVKASALSVL